MYPEQLRPGLETQANYVVEWLELTSEVGPDRFSAALVQAVRDSDYFPVISKIRNCAGMGAKKQTAAGADAAWLYVQDYLRKFPDYGEGIGRKNAPRLPARIAHAVRLAGGLGRIEFAFEDALPFIRKDFSAAWDNYEQSAASYTDLQLESPLLPRLLAAATRRGGAANPEQRAIDAVAKVIPAADAARRGPLRDDEIADLKRRAMEVEDRLTNGQMGRPSATKIEGDM